MSSDPDGDPSTPPPEHGFGKNFGVAFGGSTGREIIHRVRVRGITSLNVTAAGLWADADASGEFAVDVDAVGTYGLDIQAPSVFPIDVSARGEFATSVDGQAMFDVDVTAPGLFDLDQDAPGQVRSEMFE